MSCFSTVSGVTAASVTDLTKHVKYTAGMILGVDDFTQEFAYLAGRDRWLARDALGFGTVSGLSVKIEEDATEGYRVMVQAGVALSPRGQLICVPSAQCAFLNQWLAAADAAELDKHIRHLATSPPASPPVENELTLFVVLCYRDCPDDPVPIPGEPCRSEDELTAPSRIKDDFSLELRYEAPRHPEEAAVREYVAWLKQIEVTDSGASTSLEDFIDAIKAAWLKPSSPPVVTSPPAFLQINEDDVCEYMRAAFRVWVTDLRNVLSERKTGCAVEMTGGGKLEDCVLLARLDIPLEKFSNALKVGKSKPVAIIEEDRPFLLHLRMLQEWMLCGCRCASSEEPIVTSPPASHVHSLDDLSDVEAVFPAEGQHLVFRGGVWVAEDMINAPPVESPPSPPLALDDLSDVTVAAPSDGQILIFRGDEWIAENPPNAPVSLGLDDLSDVTVAAASDGQILTLRSGEWVAENLPPAPVSLALDDLTDVTAPSPTEGQRLVFRGGQWIAETAPTLRHGDLSDLGDDDHTQYLLVNGSRALTGNLQGGSRKIVDLAAGTANGEAVIFQQAVKNGDAAGGDLTGAFPSPTIIALQGNRLDAPVGSASVGDALVWNGAAWIPQRPSGGRTEPQLILPLATVTRVARADGGPVYEVWFNIDAPGNLAEIKTFTREHLRVFDETNAAPDFLGEQRFVVDVVSRNVFQVTLRLGANQMEPDRMRFNFNVRKIEVGFRGNSMSLLEYADNQRIKFEGFLEGEFATVFVRGSGQRDGN